MPRPGSMRSSCSSSNLARWPARRFGRAVPMQIACWVRLTRSNVRSSRRAPSPRRSRSAQIRRARHAITPDRASGVSRGSGKVSRAPTVCGGANGSIGSLTRPRAWSSRRIIITFQERDFALGLFALGIGLGAGDAVGINDQLAALALADIAAELLRLFEGQP